VCCREFAATNRSTLQHIAAHCSTALQHIATTHCNTPHYHCDTTLQHIATAQYNTLQHYCNNTCCNDRRRPSSGEAHNPERMYQPQQIAAHCNTLQNTATSLQHHITTYSHNPECTYQPQQIAAHCNNLQLTATSLQQHLSQRLKSAEEAHNTERTHQPQRLNRSPRAT